MNRARAAQARAERERDSAKHQAIARSLKYFSEKRGTTGKIRGSSFSGLGQGGGDADHIATLLRIDPVH
jgi:hypothetical protein